MTPIDVRRAAAEIEAGIGWLPESAGDDPVDVLVRDVLALSRETGAPRARALRLVADAVDDGLAIGREVRLASVASRQSAMVLTALPALTSVLAELFGFPVLAFLIGGWVGWLCIAVGSAALVAGWKWLARLRAGVIAPPLATGLVADLVSETLSTSGIRPDTELWLRDRIADWGTASEWSAVEELRQRARSTGAPVAGLLAIAADDERRRARFEVREKIETLPGSMLTPLGVCLLPAFITLTVIPAIAGMARDFVSS